MTDAGWLYAEGDPPGTNRYWDGTQWIGEPVPAPPQPPANAGNSGMQGDSGTHNISHPQGVRQATQAGFLASSGRRFSGRLIDRVLGAVIVAILVSLGALGGSEFGDTNGKIVLSAMLNDSGYQRIIDDRLEFLIWGVLWWGWNLAWTKLAGGTPGKLVLGMRIVDQQTGTTPPPLAQSALRTAAAGFPLLGVLTPSLGMLGSFAAVILGTVSLILLFSNDATKTVMDKFAKTVVIHR